jgi:tRNA(Ile)-lysidine synthase
MEIVGEEAELAAQAAGRWLQSMKSPKAEVRRPKEGRRAKAETDRASLRWLLRRNRKGQDSLPFEDLPVAVQRRCVQMQLLGQGIEPDFELVEQLRCAAGRLVNLRLGQVRTGVQTNVTRGRRTACANRKADREENAWGTGETPILRHAIRDRWGLVKLQVAAVQQFSTNSAGVDLEGNAGKIEFDGTRVSWRIDSRKANPQPRAGVQQESFDADKVGSRIRIRHWLPGDRFQPIGMTCAVKLQDFFTNQKIPRDRRRQLLVATSAQDDVFWVEGARISERFKLTQQTNRVLQWRWKRL